jgi:hypothetical protein
MGASVTKPRDYSQRISKSSRFSARKDGKTAAPLQPTAPGNSDASAEAGALDYESFR